MSDLTQEWSVHEEPQQKEQQQQLQQEGQEVWRQLVALWYDPLWDSGLGFWTYWVIVFIGAFMGMLFTLDVMDAAWWKDVKSHW